MPCIGPLTFWSLLLVVGCSKPESTVTTTANSPSLSHSVDDSTQEKLANRIKSLADERLEDPTFEVTGENQKAIDHLRSLAIMQGLQFEESTLGFCDENTTSVVFTRPECEYYLEYREASEFRNPQVSAVIVSQVNRVKPGDFPKVKRAMFNLAMIAGLAADSPLISSRNDANCRQLSEVVGSPNFGRLLDQALAGTEVDAEFDCGGLQMRFVNPPTNNPRLEIWRK